MTNKEVYKLAYAVYNAALELAINDDGDNRDFSNINPHYYEQKTIRGCVVDAISVLNDVLKQM